MGKRDIDSAEPDQLDLLSELGDLDLVRHLLADLHDDLPGKIARLRQLVDLSETLSLGEKPISRHGAKLAGASSTDISPQPYCFAKGWPNICLRDSFMPPD